MIANKRISLTDFKLLSKEKLYKLRFGQAVNVSTLCQPRAFEKNKISGLQKDIKYQ